MIHCWRWVEKPQLLQQYNVDSVLQLKQHHHKLSIFMVTTQKLLTYVKYWCTYCSKLLDFTTCSCYHNVINHSCRLLASRSPRGYAHPVLSLDARALSHPLSSYHPACVIGVRHFMWIQNYHDHYYNEWKHSRSA